MCRFLVEIKKRFQHFRNAFNHFGVMKQEVPQNMKQLFFYFQIPIYFVFFWLVLFKRTGFGFGEPHS